MERQAIRRQRLKAWFADRTIPTKEKSYFSQLINGKTPFGEKSARRIEAQYGMPAMHLDSTDEVQAVQKVTIDPLRQALDKIALVQPAKAMYLEAQIRLAAEELNGYATPPPEVKKA